MMRCPCGGVSGTSTRFSQQRLAAPAHLSHVPAGDRGTHAHVLRYRPAPDSHSELCAHAANGDCFYCGKFLRSCDLFKWSKQLLKSEIINILGHLQIKEWSLDAAHYQITKIPTERQISTRTQKLCHNDFKSQVIFHPLHQKTAFMLIRTLALWITSSTYSSMCDARQNTHTNNKAQDRKSEEKKQTFASWKQQNSVESIPLVITVNEC